MLEWELVKKKKGLVEMMSQEQHSQAFEVGLNVLG
jgi:hypothetical protein